MADEFSDEEQAERIKQWWRDNGLSVVVTVVLAVAVVVGWQQWQSYQHEQAAEASLLYTQLNEALASMSESDQGAIETIRKRAQTLMSEYGDTIYADFAALSLARLAVRNGDYKAAAKQLEKVVQSPAYEPIGTVARLRLARVAIQRGHYERVSKLLSVSIPEPWQGRALEIKGDMLLARGDIKAAREAYTSALNLLEAGSRDHRRVQMKRNDLLTAS